MKISDMEEGTYCLWTHTDPATQDRVNEKVKVIKKTGSGGSDVRRSNFEEGKKGEVPSATDWNERIEVELECGETIEVKFRELGALPDDGMTEDRE